MPKALNRVPSALHNLGFRPKALTLEPVALQRDNGSCIITLELESKVQSRVGDNALRVKGDAYMHILYQNTLVINTVLTATGVLRGQYFFRIHIYICIFCKQWYLKCSI